MNPLEMISGSRFEQKIRVLIILFSIFYIPTWAQDSLYHSISNRKNSPEQIHKPYIILISIDGFRYDYAEKYSALNLLELGKRGVTTPYMIPCYPSKTFPNHYSIVTGLYPAHHGIVDNSFFAKDRGKTYQINLKKEVDDGSWYGGIPLWALAEKQKMLSACFFWVGSEAAIGGIRPTYYYTYYDKLSFDQRINQLVSWLTLPDSIRPHFITFYLPEVDHAGHTYGPESPETRKNVQSVDSALGVMRQKLELLALPINWIVVSDHGMASINRNIPIILDRKAFDLEGVRIYGGETQLNLYVKDTTRILGVYDSLKLIENRFKVYLKKDFPKRFHYDTAEDRWGRIGDIILMADFPNIFGVKGRTPSPGTHGFDPNISEMHSIFYAEGPSFKKGIKIAPFENIEIYPLIEKILKLNPNLNVDGKLNKLKKILVP